MKTFMWLVGAVIIAWLVLSPLVWGYWYTKDVETQRSRGWGYLVGLGAFISCVYVLTEGIHAGLSFMLDSWGIYPASTFTRGGPMRATPSAASVLLGGFIKEIGICPANLIRADGGHADAVLNHQACESIAVDKHNALHALLRKANGLSGE